MRASLSASAVRTFWGACLAASAAWVQWGGVAQAAAVRGVVTLPADLKQTRKHHGYVQIENGIVPVEPPSDKGRTVVVLVGQRGTPPPARTVTVDLTGLAASPPLVVVGEGSVVELKNADRVAHDLSTPEQYALMPIERLNPGNVRRQKFQAAGGYLIRCSEYPHVNVSVIVVGSSYYDTVDEKGAFKLNEVPEGSATLKVWSQGRWVHEEHITVSSGNNDIQIRVPGPQDKGTE